MELIVVFVGIEGEDIVDKLDKIKGIRKNRGRADRRLKLKVKVGKN